MAEYIKRIKVTTWSITNRLDFNIYDREPLRVILENHGIHVLNPHIVQIDNVMVRHNEIENKVGWVDLGFVGTIYEFYDIKEVKQFYEVSDGGPGKITETLLAIEFVLTSDRRAVRREIYDLLDVLADLGGV